MAPTADDGVRLGEAFVEALGRRDFLRLEALLDPHVRFRALVPPGLRTADDAAAAAAHPRGWFGDADRFDLVASTVGRIGPRLRLSYRIRLHEEGVWYAVEQQAYLDVGGDLIRSVDILCSGFVRESDGPEGPGS
jgi:hypothetical protein